MRRLFRQKRQASDERARANLHPPTTQPDADCGIVHKELVMRTKSDGEQLSFVRCSQNAKSPGIDGKSAYALRSLDGVDHALRRAPLRRHAGHQFNRPLRRPLLFQLPTYRMGALEGANRTKVGEIVACRAQNIGGQDSPFVQANRGNVRL